MIDEDALDLLGDRGVGGYYKSILAPLTPGFHNGVLGLNLLPHLFGYKEPLLLDKLLNSLPKSREGVLRVVAFQTIDKSAGINRVETESGHRCTAFSSFGNWS